MYGRDDEGRQAAHLSPGAPSSWTIGCRIADRAI